jgi:LacI family transcriptional regulator
MRNREPQICELQSGPQNERQKAAKMLIERLEKEEDDEQYTTEIIETELIFRESTTT